MAKISVGEKFPSFYFNTQNRSDVNSLECLKGKTVFWVLRYIGCTVCRYDVHLIAQRYDEFVNKGAQVFVVMQSDVDHVVNDLRNTDETLPFEIICDPTLAIYYLLSIEPAESMEKLGGGRFDELKEKGAKARECGFVHGDYEGNEQQLPAMFIVEEDGTVCYAHYAENIMDMPKIDDVLELLS
ncbi:MAG: redoxin domain-containing protein [Erysipelotrichaceae bacterium]|nr:redoxin domain-containing protein [Erysipelotrichaceae bacterium]